MEIIKDAIKCVNCNQTLEKPVLMPCGELICENHISEGAIYCISCDSEHEIKTDGSNYSRVKAIEKLLNAHLDKFDFGPEYQAAYRSCIDLDMSLAEFDRLLTDAVFFIDRAIKPLKDSVEIKAQELGFEIDAKKSNAIDLLDKYQAECEENLKRFEFEPMFNDMSEKMDERKEALANNFRELESTFQLNPEKMEGIRNENRNVKEKCEKEMSLVITNNLLMGKMMEYKNIVKEFSNLTLSNNKQMATDNK